MTPSFAGKLVFGVCYQGKCYKDVEVKLLTLGGECAALEELETLALPEESRKQSDMMLRELVYLAQLVRVIGLPSHVITGQFLLDNLAPSDYVLLVNLLDALRKKLLGDTDSLPNEENVESATV